jgi:hypothetical protein
VPALAAVRASLGLPAATGPVVQGQVIRSSYALGPVESAAETEARLVRNAARLAQIDALGGGFGGRIGGGGGSGGTGEGGIVGAGDGGTGGTRSRALSTFLTTTRYFASYAVLSESIRLIKEIRNETEAYSVAVNQLTIALDGNVGKAQELANGLANISAGYAQSPQVAFTGGVQFARAFKGENTPEGLATQGGIVAGQLNLLGDPKKLQENLTAVVGILTSFGLGAGSGGALLDAATQAAQRNGFASPEAILPGLAQIADLAHQSGFSAAESAGIVATITKYTGETSDAAAGELRRFLGRSGNAAFQNIFAEYGINTNQSLSGELQQLAPIFQRLSPQAKANVTSQLGGGRAGAAVVATIEGLPTITKDAANITPGIAESQAQLKLATFAGLIEQISGNFQQLAKDLGQSGLGADIGALLKAFNALLVVVDDVLNAFDQLPGALQQILLLAGGGALLARAAGSGSAGFFATAARRGIGVFGDASAANALAAAQARVTALQAEGAGAAAELAAAQAELDAAQAAGTGSMLRMVGSLGLLAAAAALAIGAIVLVGNAITANAKYDTVEEKIKADLLLPTRTAKERDIRDYALRADKAELQGIGDTLGGAVAGSVREGRTPRPGLRGGGAGKPRGGPRTSPEINATDAIDAALAADQKEGVDQAARTGDVSGAIRSAIQKGGSALTLVKALNKITESISGDLDLSALLNPNSNKATPAIGDLVKAAQNATKNEGSVGKRIKDYGALVDAVNGAIEKAQFEGADPTSIQNLSNLRDKVQSAYFTAMEKQLKAQEKAILSHGKTSGNYAKIRALVAQDVVIAATSGNSDAVAKLLEGADKATVAIVRAQIMRMIDAQIAAVKAADDALAKAQTLAALANDASAYAYANTGPVGQKDTSAAAKLARLKASEATLNTGSSLANLTGKNTGTSTSTDTAEQIAAAKAAAYAVRTGGGIAEATAGIQTAKANLDAAKKNTVAYYQALGAYFQAQQALKDALTAYQHNLHLLGIDQTNPVAVATLALNEARAKLARDRGKGKDVVAQDRLDVQNAQTALEAAKFSQRLSDAQTAERLGRISHAAYIQYLENEHRRLQAIAHRTRQQQDELDQIDGLLKDAQDSFAGQFNLGNIKLPTPYEVRRYITESAHAATVAAGRAGGNDAVPDHGARHQTSIHIDGTDVGMVIQVLSQYLGPGAVSRTGTTSKKV